MEKNYTNLKKTEDKRGEVEFKAEIPLEVIEIYVGHVLAQAAEDFSLPGFRKGKVPHDMVRARMDEMGLLEDAADEALRDAVREIINDENLSLVGSPQLTVTKIAIKNPIEFKVRFAVYPAIKLPDYKKIGTDITARKDEAKPVTDEELETAVKRLLDARGAETLTDETVQKFGPFKTVDEFKAKLRENLASEKAFEAKDAKREEIMRSIVQGSSVDMPKMLMDQEWQTFKDRRDAELEEAKLSLESYLKETGKTEAQLEKDERALIEERLKTSMVFREIQKTENIEPSEKEIQTNIAYLKMRYSDRSEAWLRETAEALIVQEKIFAMLGAAIESEA